MTFAHSSFARRLLSAVALTVMAGSTFAASVYTSSAAFLANVATASYTESFDGLSSASTGLFSGGAFSYTVSAPSDIYFSGDFLGTNQVGEALTITFTSGNVRALGANFFATNISDAFQAHSLTLSLSDGTVETFSPTSLLDSYRGFISNVAITSMIISGTANTSLYAGLDNFTVGTVSVTPVPEPEILALLGVGLLAIRVARRRAA